MSWLSDLFRPKNSRTNTENSSVAESYRSKADESDARAKQLNIDPPRSGRRTYTDRYQEASSMSSSDRRSLIALRQAQGKQVGVLLRAEADYQDSLGGSEE